MSLHCSPCSGVRGQVLYVHGLWSMMCHVHLCWHLWLCFDMAIRYDLICYVLWRQCRGRPRSVHRVPNRAGSGICFLSALFMISDMHIDWLSTSFVFRTLCSDSDIIYYSLCFTYSVHFPYWPPFFGGCVSCPQVPIHGLQIRPLRLSISCFQRSFVRSYIFWYSLFLIHLYIWFSGYDGALSRHMYMLSVCRGL